MYTSFLVLETLKMVRKEKEPFNHITNFYSKFYTKKKNSFKCYRIVSLY